jgi:hypothetical protein
MRRRRRINPHRRAVVLAATALALATGVGAGARAPLRADGGHATAASEVATAANKPGTAARKPYKPARLWYRVTVEFKGEKVKPPASLTPQFGEARWSGAWRLRSDHAVRLTLLCHDYDRPGSEPFAVRRKIGGRLVTVGGCGQSARDGLKPTLRFAARATGEWTRYEYVQHARPAQGCSPGELWRREQLVSSQPLAGAISTADSAGEGLALGASSTAPFGTFLFQRWRCDGDLEEGQRQFDAGGWLFGSEEPFANPKAMARWVPLRRYLGFRFPVARFGRSFDVKLSARQFPQDPGYPAPPAELGGAAADALLEKRYSYVLRFQPCPRGGLDVRRC